MSSSSPSRRDSWLRPPGCRSAPARTIVLASGLLLLVTPPCAGGEPQLVKDINVLPTAGLSSYPTDGVVAGETLFFVARDERHGSELWAISAGDDEPRRVRDIATGMIGSAIDSMTAIGDRVAFTADDGRHGREPWISDGTPQGTWMLGDIKPGQADSMNTFAEFVLAGSQIYFVADDGLHGRELWVSGGAAGDARLVADLRAGPLSSYIVPSSLPLDDRLLFAANSGPADSDVRVWISDGTEEGTVPLSPSCPDCGWTAIFGVAGEIAYFVSPEGSPHGSELWRTDGTEEGTVMVADIEPAGSSAPDGLTVIGSRLFFSAIRSGVGRGLWVTDGTEEGTTLVLDAVPGSDADNVTYLMPFHDRLLFTVRCGSNDNELWITDGSTRGTVQLAEGTFWLWDEYTEVVGDLAYIANGSFLWTTDGTPQGTRVVGSVWNPQDLMPLRGGVLFGCNESSSQGSEPCYSDGTDEGTFMLREIYPGAISGYGAPLGVVGDLAYFRGNDQEHGDELWRSDATTEGTVIAADISASGASSDPSDLTPLGNGDALFAADDGENGRELWRTDGTEGGTWLVADIDPGEGSSSPAGFAPVGNGWVLFGASDGEHGYELWRTDGSPDGTEMVSDLYPGPYGSNPGSAFTWNGRVFFGAVGPDGEHGLWRSDGTSAGTVRLAVVPVDVGDPPLIFGGLEDCVVIFAPSYGYRLWRSDGTPEGTVQVTGLYYPMSGPLPTAELSGVLYFPASGNDGAGIELWRTDGTAEGTHLVKDIWPLDSNSAPALLTVSGGLLYFTASEHIHGRELWTSDGTESGTAMVVDLSPGGSWTDFERLMPFQGEVFAGAEVERERGLWRSDGTAEGTVLWDAEVYPRGVPWSDPFTSTHAAFDGYLYFCAETDDLGFELWRTDGRTPPELVMDLRPGRDSSLPDGLTVIGDALYFTADDGAHGRELWRILAGPPTPRRVRDRRLIAP